MRILLLSTLFALLSLPVLAQIDAKLNAGSALTGGINVAGDIVLGQHTSLSLGFGRAVTTVTINDNEYKLKRWRFIPEFRYYFNPDAGADNLFVGAYGRLVDVKGQNTTNGDDVDGIRAALGIMAGQKWVTRNGFVFEINAGIGRARLYGEEGNGSAINTSLALASSIDLRLGLLVGYRFGGA
jgi:hypothetical protein